MSDQKLSNSRILRVGVIGCGSIFLSHSQAYPDHPNAVLVGFYDRIRNRAENWKNQMTRYMEYVREAAQDEEHEDDTLLLEKCGIFDSEANVYDSVHELLERVDAIDVCTPNQAHVPYALWALKKGKSVMTEKPPARCSLETKRLVETQKSSGAYYQLNENFLWHTAVRKMRELIEKGIIGELKSVKTRLGHGGPSWGWNNHFLNPSMSGGGCLSDMGIHAMGLGYGALGPEYDVVKVKSLQMNSGTMPEQTLKYSDGANEYYMSRFMVEDHALIRAWLSKTPSDSQSSNQKSLLVWEIETSWAKTFQSIEVKGEKGTLSLERDEKKREILVHKTPDGEKTIHDVPPQGRDSHQLEVVDFFNRVGLEKPLDPYLGPAWAHKMQTILSCAYLSNLRVYQKHRSEKGSMTKRSSSVNYGEGVFITPDELSAFYEKVIVSGCPEEIVVEEIVWNFMSPFTAKYFESDEEFNLPQ